MKKILNKENASPKKVEIAAEYLALKADPTIKRSDAAKIVAQKYGVSTSYVYTIANRVALGSPLPFNVDDLALCVADSFDIKHKEAKKIVKCVFDSITQAILDNRKVSIKGFVSIKVTKLRLNKVFDLYHKTSYAPEREYRKLQFTPSLKLKKAIQNAEEQ